MTLLVKETGTKVRRTERHQTLPFERALSPSEVLLDAFESP